MDYFTCIDNGAIIADCSHMHIRHARCFIE
jgi:hypothetical protein